MILQALATGIGIGIGAALASWALGSLRDLIGGFLGGFLEKRLALVEQAHCKHTSNTAVDYICCDCAMVCKHDVKSGNIRWITIEDAVGIDKVEP